MLKNKANNVNEDEELIEENNEDDEYVPIIKGDTNINFEIRDMSIQEIINMLNEDRIIVNSDYQRAFVWKELVQLRLIDSIFIGMPIPPIWLVKRNDRKMEVVDGLQRISTIKNFYDNKLKLDNMSFKDLNKKYFENLREEFRYDFLDSTLKLAIINYDSYKDKNFIYELFKRINQNTVPLTKQELRNATFISNFNNKLKEFAQSDSVLEKVIPNKRYGSRMKNIEMFYRFLGAYKKYNVEKGIVINLASTDERVTKFMEDAINFSDSDDNEYLKVLRDAIYKVYKVFGENSFRKWEYDKFKNILNVPLMEMQLISLYHIDEEKLIRYKNDIIKEYQKLFEDEDFNYSLRAATDSQENTNLRLKKFRDRLSSISDFYG